ncbi:uncharacterized protein H6S33_007222 [Morchella sextelata]|uniref:uncharacterized protein n=1 Tax=Morchella sextelata TaxID=1174677 RepID=UPI001D0562E5|nr:uncharacterized protein H6S33_007222 [Morchella sextelata]KAH0604191.1 hypothetical protein H6S33_007222 [Morchella sextelata]
MSTERRISQWPHPDLFMEIYADTGPSLFDPYMRLNAIPYGIAIADVEAYSKFGPDDRFTTWADDQIKEAGVDYVRDNPTYNLFGNNCYDFVKAIVRRITTRGPISVEATRDLKPDAAVLEVYRAHVRGVNEFLTGYGLPEHEQLLNRFVVD